MHVEIPADRITAKLEEQFKELRQQAAIPGFRVGHAPQKLIETRFSADVKDQVRGALIRESYEQAVEKNKLEVIGEPVFDNADAIQLPESGSLTYSFEVEVGGAARAVAPPRTNVLDAVLAALAAPASWRGTLPAGADANGVTLAADALPEGEAWVRPGGEVEARQTAAPLDRTLDHYGIYAIDGPARLDVEGAGLGVGDSAVEGVEWETVLDWFAPAHGAFNRSVAEMLTQVQQE